MKAKLRYMLIIAIIISIPSITFFLPKIKLFINQASNSSLIDRVKNEALPANIEILQLQYRNDGNSSSVSFSAGASGVIIGKEGNKYYALTANHVITKLDDVDETQIIVLAYDNPGYADTLRNGEEFQGLSDYYQQFPIAVVEYSNDKYDLAVISFVADEVYTVLSVARESPKQGDTVVSMSNPHGKRNVVTAGKISSKKPIQFGDEAGEMQYSIIEHTALLSTGSSGSALLNKDLEIVGINLGGSENLFRQFLYGKAMPSDRIIDFLQEWEVIKQSNYVSTGK